MERTASSSCGAKVRGVGIRERWRVFSERGPRLPKLGLNSSACSIATLSNLTCATKPLDMKQPILNRLNPLWRVAMASTLLALSGCLGLPPSPLSSPTHTLAASADAPLSNVVEASRATQGASGFRLLPSGPDALQA
eukprot:gene60912-81220_t